MEHSNEDRKYQRWRADEVVLMDILGPDRETLLVRIVDVSQSGVRVRGVESAQPGSPVAIKSGQNILLGEIVWCAMGDAGIVLEQLLNFEELEKLRDS